MNPNPNPNQARQQLQLEQQAATQARVQQEQEQVTQKAQLQAQLQARRQQQQQQQPGSSARAISPRGGGGGGGGGGPPVMRFHQPQRSPRASAPGDGVVTSGDGMEAVTAPAVPSTGQVAAPVSAGGPSPNTRRKQRMLYNSSRTRILERVATG